MYVLLVFGFLGKGVVFYIGYVDNSIYTFDLDVNTKIEHLRRFLGG